MRIIEFSNKEIELIKKSIEFRLNTSQKNIESYKEHISELNEILRRISLSYIVLKPMQKAIIIGCVRELVIYPNEDLINLSDFQLFSLYESSKEKIRFVDIGLNVVTKIQRKRERKVESFESRIAKINSALKIQEVYYSITNDGMIYKVGLLSQKDRGIHINVKGSLISNFSFSKLCKEYYMKSAKPKEIIEKMNTYGKQNEFTENYNRLIKILENACV